MWKKFVFVFVLFDWRVFSSLPQVSLVLTSKKLSLCKNCTFFANTTLRRSSLAPLLLQPECHPEAPLGNELYDQTLSARMGKNHFGDSIGACTCSKRSRRSSLHKGKKKNSGKKREVRLYNFVRRLL